MLVSPPAYPGLINIGAFSLSFRDFAVIPKGFNASINSPIGLVFRESSPVSITSLSLNADAEVISLKVVPELAKSIGSSDELCSFPPVPMTSR